MDDEQATQEQNQNPVSEFLGGVGDAIAAPFQIAGSGIKSFGQGIGLLGPDEPEKLKINPEKFSPEEFEREAREIVQQDIQSGVVDPEKIKQNIKRHVQNKVDTQIIQKVRDKEDPSVSGFFGNVKRNTEEIVDGLGAMLGMGAKTVFHSALNPIDSAYQVGNFTKQMVMSPQYRSEVYQKYGKPIVDEYKEYRNPFQKMYEDPVDVVLDATALLSLGGTTLAKTGAKSATKAAANTKAAARVRNAREAVRTARTPDQARVAQRELNAAQAANAADELPQAFRNAKIIEDTGERLMSASNVFSLKNISAGTKKVIEQMPGGKEVVKNMETRKATRKNLNKSQAAFLAERNKVFKQIDDRIKRLTDDEAAILPQVAEGFTQVPGNASNDFYESLGLMRSLAKDQERFGLKIGKFTPEIVERRKWQPLAKHLEKEGKLETEGVAKQRKPIDEEIGKINKQIDKIRKRHADGKLSKSQMQKRVKKKKQELAKQEQKMQDVFDKYGFSSLTGDELRGQIEVIKRFFPDADPIYMRHFMEDKPKRFSDFFLNTKAVRSFEPGSTKKSYGRDGYIGQDPNRVTKADLDDVLKRQAAENLKWQRNIELLENIKKDPRVKPLRQGEDPAPGHRIFAPDGLIKFYRSSMDLTDELKKRGDQVTDENVWETFQDAVDNAFPEGATKEMTGIRKAKVYQVPDAMADELNKQVKSSNPYIKLFYDKPLDAFRFAALSLFPRWQVNNAVGNAVFSIMQGDVLNPKAFYMQHQLRKTNEDLFPDHLFGGVHRAERTTSGKLGSAVDLPLVKSTMAMHDKLLESGNIGKLVRNAESGVKKAARPVVGISDISFRLNQAVDDAFKGAAFVNRALKADRKNMLQRMGSSFEDSLKALENLKGNQKLSEKIVDDVHTWYYHGLNLTDFERRVMRRAVPFYSWMRWASLYSAHLATEQPVRANVVSKMARDFNMFTGQNELPEDLAGAVPVGNAEDGTVYYLRTTGLNPFSHINDIMRQGFVGTALKGSAPPIQTAVEQTTGRDLFLGRKFTRSDMNKAFNGEMWKFDPELGEVTKVDETVAPGLLENTLRNYIPQYMMMETLLTGGRSRYTAEGLDTILADLFRDPEEREAIVKDVITQQARNNVDPFEERMREFSKAFGVNIAEKTPEDQKARREAQQRATRAIRNREIPIMNDRFKNLLKERIQKEIIVNKTPRDELQGKIQEWIGFHVNELKKLKQ